jgi:hypothetical protein
MKYLAIISCLFFFACKKVNTKESATTTIPLNTCKTFTLSNEFNICYDSLLYDLRCPANLICITNGPAVVKLILNQNNTAIPFKIGSMQNYPGHPSNDTTINGIHIKLKEVLDDVNSNANKIILEVN